LNTELSGDKEIQRQLR